MCGIQRRPGARHGGAVSSPIRWEFAVSGGRELERDLTNLLFSLTCSMVYSVPARDSCGCGPIRLRASRHIYFQICLTARTGQRAASKCGARREQATTAGRALTAVREMADVGGVHLVCNRGPAAQHLGHVRKTDRWLQPGRPEPLADQRAARRFVTDKLVGR
jgi:hypothetical protein